MFLEIIKWLAIFFIVTDTLADFAIKFGKLNECKDNTSRISRFIGQLCGVALRAYGVYIIILF